MPGSSPLDLFWDVVDELDRQAEDDQRLVESVLADKKQPVAEKTTLEEFEATLKGEERIAQLDEATLRGAFERVSGLCSSLARLKLTRLLSQLHSRAVRAAKEDRRRAEKKLRLQIDDLRYAYKKLDPPVDLESTYEEVSSRGHGGLCFPDSSLNAGPLSYQGYARVHRA